VDINNDGFYDIISGSYSNKGKDFPGFIYVLLGKPDGTFGSVEVLKGIDNRPLQTLYENRSTRPSAVDWDNDGHLDLITGNSRGTLYFFKGLGNGTFNNGSTQIFSGKEPLKILVNHSAGGHSDPCIVDWDQDGDLDIVSGSTRGGVHWSENTGNRTIANMQKFRELIPPNESFSRYHYHHKTLENPGDGPTSSTRVWVYDMNGDSKLDIIVGDSSRLMEKKKGIPTEVFEKKFQEWDIEKQRLLNLEVKGPDQLHNHLVKIHDLVQSQSTGFVWCYFQK